MRASSYFSGVYALRHLSPPNQIKQLDYITGEIYNHFRLSETRLKTEEIEVTARLMSSEPDENKALLVFPDEGDAYFEANCQPEYGAKPESFPLFNKRDGFEKISQERLGDYRQIADVYGQR